MGGPASSESNVLASVSGPILLFTALDYTELSKRVATSSMPFLLCGRKSTSLLVPKIRLLSVRWAGSGLSLWLALGYFHN